ncbi:DNA polymerase epsilon subunit C [Tolypocladium capitatum]|uniref:NCT transcriptional regulatory complex subunit A n=1 Tax=Tolypocladium capitatum TaxID=45235 RepID=A0A2K3QHP8_9HYPO|nr:DNA polymerase epsilon subunit C [Tolypocladium capitatum]
MSGDDNNTTSNSNSSYAPKSPDLSSFYSTGPTQPASQLHPRGQSRGEYKLQPPADRYGSASSSSYAPPIPPVAHHHIKPEPSPPTQQHSLRLSLQLDTAPSQASYGLPPPTPQQQPPLPCGQSHALLDQSRHPSAPLQQSYHQDPVPTRPPARAQADPEMPPRRAAAAPPPPAIEPSPVKTKFPTARIKRIMQADEEVGKVAQQTPIAVGKALELFMIQLVSKSASVAKERGSKRVTASMLKLVVETDDQWDFLREIVGRVENDKEGSRAKAKTESDSDDDDDDDDDEMVEPKKRSRAGGRKKRA